MSFLKVPIKTSVEKLLRTHFCSEKKQKKKHAGNVCSAQNRFFHTHKIIQNRGAATKNTCHLHSWWDNFHKEKPTENLMHIFTDTKLRPTEYTHQLAA